MNRRNYVGSLSRFSIAILAGTATVALLATSAPPVVSQSGGSPANACVSEDHRRFDFWVGEWSVASPDGKHVGTNRIEKTLNDCVLNENWEGKDGSIGTSYNMFFSRDGQWHQTWVDGNGGRLDLKGGWKKNRMVLSGSMPGSDKSTVLHEISWTPRKDGTVRQHWRASKDGGKNWQDLFDGIYTRRPAS